MRTAITLALWVWMIDKLATAANAPSTFPFWPRVFVSIMGLVTVLLALREDLNKW